jgi:hypothetical protein
MMLFFRILFGSVGAGVVTLWAFGALGLGDFRLYFGPVGSIDCKVEKKPSAGEETDR